MADDQRGGASSADITATKAFVPADLVAGTALLDALVAGSQHAFAWAAVLILLITPISLVLVRASRTDVGGDA